MSLRAVGLEPKLQASKSLSVTDSSPSEPDLSSLESDSEPVSGPSESDLNS